MQYEMNLIISGGTGSGKTECFLLPLFAQLARESATWDAVETKYPPESTIQGRVVNVMPYGAFVEILPGQDGLLHISEVAFERIPDIRDRLAEGDQIKVKIIDIDGYDRIKLSHRAVLEDEMRERGEEVPERPSREPERDRGGPRDRDRDRRGGRGGNDRRGGRSNDRRGGRGGGR